MQRLSRLVFIDKGSALQYTSGLWLCNNCDKGKLKDKMDTFVEHSLRLIEKSATIS